MSSAPRDEGGRARRRRRRGPASASRTDPNNTNPNRPPRRSPQPHQRGHHQQQPPQALQSQHIDSLSFSASGITTIPQRNVRDNSRQRQSNPHADTLKNEAKTSQASRAAQGKQNAIDEQKRKKEEEERKEKEARELKERAEREEREATLARQLEKQHQQRILNLSYRPRKPSQPPEKERPSDAQLRQLDSSLKKCTGFLRKIRSSGINEESLPSLCREAQSLNLSRYISEVVAAISETKLRYADVEHATVLTGELYRRYEDFVTQLVAALGAIILSQPNNAPGRDVGSRKAAMRLLVEIFVLGMVADVSPITNVLKQLVRVQKDARDESLSHLSIITTFVRTGGRTMLSQVSKPTSESSSSHDLEEMGEDWRDSVLSQSTKGSITLAFQSYYDAEVNRLLTEAAEELDKAYIAVTRSKDVRGDPDEAATATYESARQGYEKVYASARVLADALGKRLPESVLSITQGTSSTVESSTPRDTAQGAAINSIQYVGRNRIVQESDFLLQGESPFDGEEERLFYTMLPILKQKGSSASEDGKSIGLLVNGTVPEPDASDSATKTASSGGKKVESRQSPVAKNTVEGRQKGSDKPASVEKVLGQLSTVESKESVDAFVSHFVDTAESSKNGSKRLAKSLSSVSAQKLNLLPTYSRIAACLYPSFSDIAISVASHLEEEFRYLAGRSDMDEKNLAVCIKNAKYVGEYVKFGLIESSSMFDLLNLCMKDFTGHRVDIACHLLETCGRFLYRTPATHVRMGNILETIWRLKSVKNMEARHNALVETAYFASKPTSASKLQKRKSRPPIHEYIRHLIYYRLDATNIKWTQTQLMKLPWNDDLEHYVIKKFVKISRARFSTIPYVSTLISLLQRFKPGLVIGIVDALLEAIRCGMEKNDGRDSQRRIAEIQLLGELHKCGVVDEGLVYNVLYQSIILGHDRSEVASTQILPTDETSRSERASLSRAGAGSAVPTSTFTNAPDPPGDFFRVRIACVLLESCGRILVASNRRKVEVFWIFFERYTFYKARQAGLGDRLPLHISHVVGDAFENILLRDRRYGRDNRMRKENETFIRTRSGQSHTRQYSPSARFFRSSSLSEAIEAVQQVENSISDRVLICVPVRHIYQNCAPLNGTRPSSGASLNDAPGLHSISRTEKQPGLSETDSSEGSNNDGADSDTEGVTSELSENGMLGEREDLFSGDDLTEENELPRNAIDGEGNRGEDSEHDECEDVDDEDDEDDSSVEVQVERPKTEEEDAFAKELAAFTADAVQTARATSSRITKFDRMAIPMSLMAKKMEEERAARAAAAANLHLNSESDDSDDRMGNSSLTKMKRRSPSQSVGFKVLVRKGGKSQLQDLEVPASSSLAVAAKENETADAARHEETKRLVLGSSIVLNHDEEDLDEEVPLRTQQNVRAKEESIRLQRSADEMALLSAVYHHRPNTRR
ncbi:unnamed protein product [Chondrus crispus]|uniref:MIF4G domain-containing protein n=1 Tax=Chondrus crispus TaxID=2769 RepID=R7QMY7_CHOCR|nr:unnamed protein product [Chondrus crispus]CDF38846.1 unnamed protein product [Chondrus crispus]|eukprot:XP_005718751.1 unnamed protein product [Chondrus crispus]